MSSDIGYLDKALRQESLEDIRDGIDKAIKKGYFDNKKSEHFYREAIASPTSKYLERYRNIWVEHDNFSNKLLKLLPEIESEENPLLRLEKALPFLETALENDAIICGYTIALRDNESPEGQLGRTVNQLKDFAEQSGEDYLVLLNPYLFLSFETTLLIEVLEIFAKMKNKGWILRNFSKDPGFRNFSSNYCYNIDTLAFRFIRPFFGFFDVAEEETYRIIQNKNEIDGSTERVNASILEKLSSAERGLFKEEFILAQQLLYFDFFEEPRRRYNVLNGLGDYFLRSCVVRALHEMDYVSTIDPMDIQQDKIYSIAKEVLCR